MAMHEDVDFYVFLILCKAHLSTLLTARNEKETKARENKFNEQLGTRKDLKRPCPEKTTPYII